MSQAFEQNIGVNYATKFVHDTIIASYLVSCKPIYSETSLQLLKILDIPMSISKPEGTAHLTQAQVAQFVNDGFVIVPGLVDPDRVRAGLKELKNKTGIVPDESKTWPKDKNGMHVTQEGIAIDRTMCISPKLKAIVRELAGPAVTNEPGLSPILRFPQPGTQTI